jgi:succinyl-diaminopimelate desuccinylase
VTPRTGSDPPTELSERLARTLVWLCSIPSPTGEEGPLSRAIAERFSLRDVPLVRYGSSLVVPLWRGSSGPSVVLAGHLDHVRTAHDAPPRRDGDRIYGPGASDMKSGLGLMLDLAERGPRVGVELTLVFYAGEEGSHEANELGLVLAADPDVRSADIAVLLEPTDNRLELGSGGSVHARVRFRGKSAHSARPWQGLNAIYAALPLLGELSAMQPRRHLTEGLAWNELVTATMAQGGRARNVVPDCFELNLNHRFGPETTLDASERTLRQLAGPEAELEIVDQSPPAPPARHHPLVAAFTEAGVRGVGPKLGWTDVARFHAAGIRAVNFGPGLVAQAHQENEWTSLTELVAGSSILDRWLELVSVV